MNLYRIANWESSFETYETKKLTHLKWVPVPNKHDGLGFRKVASQRNRCELFAAWNLILQIASKGRKDSERGRLIRDGRPLTSADMSMMTGFPASMFEIALNFFSSSEMGWLIIEPQAPTDKTAASPVKTAASPAEWKEGREGKVGAAEPTAPELFPADVEVKPGAVPKKPSPELRSRAILLLTTLNETASRRYELCDDNLKPIMKRLMEGHPVEEIQKMILREVAREGGESKWLRPPTLFGANFHGAYGDRDLPIRINGKQVKQGLQPSGSGNL